MKKQRLAALMMAGIMSVFCAGIAMAATGTKTATLNNAKVWFNGGAVQTIQCYNIDGSNYVRARDITNNLNMGVTPIKNGKNGIMVHPYETATKTTPATLTKQSAVVKLVDGEIFFDGTGIYTECFLLDGSYFFKVAERGYVDADRSCGIKDSSTFWCLDGYTVNNKLYHLLTLPPFKVAQP